MHLVVDLSAHGYGHLSLTAPVLRRLAEHHQRLRLTVRTGLSGAVIARRLQLPFEHVTTQTDFGMRMRSTLEVDVEASCKAYAELHADWEKRIATETAALASLQPDLVLSSVSYASLAAAAALGVPGVALSSLHWADIYAHIAAGRPEFTRIHEEMCAAYRAAAVFLQPQPSMPMTSLPNVKAIGPVGITGRNRRGEIAKAMALAPDERVAFISMGGIETPLPLDAWPEVKQLRYIVPAAQNPPRSRAFTVLETLPMPVTDVIASMDAFVTKPGYNSFVEAALAGTPVLYLRRQDWPEEAHLLRWLHAHSRCAEVSAHALQSGDFRDALEALLRLPPQPPVLPSGTEEAAKTILALLRG